VAESETSLQRLAHRECVQHLRGGFAVTTRLLEGSDERNVLLGEQKVTWRTAQIVHAAERAIRQSSAVLHIQIGQLAQ
jgi:hypothetical protein